MDLGPHAAYIWASYAAVTAGIGALVVSEDGAQIEGIRNAPDGFISWALKHGAIPHSADESPTTQP